jgi:class 3 adenylate cyclase
MQIMARHVVPLAVLRVLTHRPLTGPELAGELSPALGIAPHALRSELPSVVESLAREGLIEGEAGTGELRYALTVAGDAAVLDRFEVRIPGWRGPDPLGADRPGSQAGAPARTVAILFTDLVGSTRLFEQVGDDAAQAVVRRHFALLRCAIGNHGGREIKSLGDGLMVVFGVASRAVDCAVAMHQAVYECGDPVSLRVGMDAGTPLCEAGDFFGRPVIVARRLCDAAGGGQALVSDMVRQKMPAGTGHHFDSLGLLKLKGLSTPVVAYAINPGPRLPVPTAAR